MKKSPLELGGGPPGDVGPVKMLHGDMIGMRIDGICAVHELGLPLPPEINFLPGGGTPKGVGYETHADKSLPNEGRGGHPPHGVPPHGAPPFGKPPTPLGFSAIGMSNHKAEGLFPYDSHGKTNLPNLWAAGDSLSSMQNGAGYAGFGCACAGSCVQGARSGVAVAKAVENIPEPVVDLAYLEDLQEKMLQPYHNDTGFSPAWVVQMMQNIMFPYFVMYYKEKTRMESALSQIMYLQKQFGDNLMVEDFHGLRVAHECKNMLLLAEMKLRSGLAREESRGTHIREDFPYRDDENFLCYIKLVEKEGEMVAVKHPLPEEWKPDSSLGYREKYPNPYPNEENHFKETEG